MNKIIFLLVLFLFIGCGYKADPVYIDKKSELKK